MTTPPQTPAPDPGERAPPKVRFDWQDWLPFIAASDAPEAKKRELIETYWAIILTFVDLGWEVGAPTSSREETSGQVLDLTAALRAAVVCWEVTDKTHNLPSSSEAVGQEGEEA